MYYMFKINATTLKEHSASRCFLIVVLCEPGKVKRTKKNDDSNVQRCLCVLSIDKNNFKLVLTE